MSAVLTPPNFSPSVPSVTPTNPDPLLTVEEFEAMDNRGYELVDGRLEEKGMGWKTSKIGAKICAELSAYCGTHDVGSVYNNECGYRMLPNRRQQVRKPDASFIAASRAPKSSDPDGWLSMVPDLAVEIISPNEMATKLKKKLGEYHEAAIPLIWVVWPDTQTVEVYRVGVPMETIGVDGTLTGEPVLPGFTLKVSDLFAE